MTEYIYNPHRHVKIWLSKDRRSFLNALNQLRLVRMRARNPHDIIHFVYDSALLSPIAKNELQAFCTLHNLIAFDIKEIDTAELTEIERNLMRCYRDETNTQGDGNLAAASDILRVLSPVYKLGTYTDFDVEVNTGSLPESIIVNSPLLLPIGSIILDIAINDNVQESEKIERVIFNNDILAVVDVEAAKHDMQLIQNAMYRAWEPPEYPKFIYNVLCYEKDVEDLRNLGVDADEIGLMPIRLIDIQIVYPELTPPQLRHMINTITSSIQNYARFILIYSGNNPDAFATDKERLNEAARVIRELNPQLQLSNYENLSALELLTSCQFDRQDLLMNSVTTITGPELIHHALYKSYMTSEEVCEYAKPMAISSYRLNENFISNNATIFHNTQEDYTNRLFVDADAEDQNDLSWMQSGESFVRRYENKLNRNAFTLQRFFLSVQEHKTIQFKIEKISNLIQRQLEQIGLQNPENETENNILNELHNFIKTNFNKSNYSLLPAINMYSKNFQALSNDSVKIFEEFFDIFNIDARVLEEQTDSSLKFK